MEIKTFSIWIFLRSGGAFVRVYSIGYEVEVTVSSLYLHREP